MESIPIACIYYIKLIFLACWSIDLRVLRYVTFLNLELRVFILGKHVICVVLG